MLALAPATRLAAGPVVQANIGTSGSEGAYITLPNWPRLQRHPK